MTERLYYSDSFLLEFEATVTDVRLINGRTAVLLNRSAFYPASGGQLPDTGWLRAAENRLRVVDVAEQDGSILHFLDVAPGQELQATFQPNAVVRGAIDAPVRRDHMQQHSGQHVISAAFVGLFNLPTVSFHMGEQTCTIDLEAKSLSSGQLREAEALANRVVFENRPVEISSATVEQARLMGVRKIPPELEGDLRLIDIRDFDLNACGGTHVSTTGQIGVILLRKTEKVKQGVRVEFVCGARAVNTARQDFECLTEAAELYSAHLRTVPEQIRKSLDELKAAQKERKHLLEELAELHAAKLLSEARPIPRPDGQQPEIRLITKVFPDRDLEFVKFVGQKLARSSDFGMVIAFLGAGGDGGQPALVFAQKPGGPLDMGALIKRALGALGGRGGGARDMAQGGVPAGANLANVIAEIVAEQFEIVPGKD